MNILITGGTGKISEELGIQLVSAGHSLFILTRSANKNHGQLAFPAELVEHDLTRTPLDLSLLKKMDAVIHLMGETVDDYWTVKKKERIFESRVSSSKNLADSIRHLTVQNQKSGELNRLQVVISASAQAIYGDTGDEILPESKAEVLFEELKNNSTHSSALGFLQDVCLRWEYPFRELAEQGLCRCVQLRIPIVLDAQFGALKKMLPIFQRGIGAKLGNGYQWMSWVSLNDMVRIIRFALENQSIQGPLNCGSPNPVQNSAFTQFLVQSLDTVQVPPVPSFVLKMMFGEMSQIVLASLRMQPEQLQKHGFVFEDADLATFFNQHLKPNRGRQVRLIRRQFIAKPKDQVFEFFSDAKNLEQITPGYLHFKVEMVSDDTLKKDTRIHYKLSLHGIPFSWTTRITKWSPPDEFADYQEKGPYTKWDHTHRFSDLAGGTLMVDQVDFQLPMGWLGYFTAHSFVQSDVEDIFNFRLKTIAKIFR